VSVKLINLARIIRSKNAGPTQLTIDIMFDDQATFDTARMSPNLTAHEIARRYKISHTDVEIIAYPPANALKIVLARSIIAGTPGDRDVYGAQQHGPLLDLVL
jgi:hypothetical protein